MRIAQGPCCSFLCRSSFSMCAAKVSALLVVFMPCDMEGDGLHLSPRGPCCFHLGYLCPVSMLFLFSSFVWFLQTQNMHIIANLFDMCPWSRCWAPSTRGMVGSVLMVCRVAMHFEDRERGPLVALFSRIVICSSICHSAGVIYFKTFCVCV